MNRYWIIFYEAKYRNNVSNFGSFTFITYNKFLNQDEIENDISYTVDRENFLYIIIVNFKEVNKEEYEEWNR